MPGPSPKADVLTKKGWERAAIVAAFVRLERDYTDDGTFPTMGTVRFSRLGIAGLRSKDTGLPPTACGPRHVVEGNVGSEGGHR